MMVPWTFVKPKEPIKSCDYHTFPWFGGIHSKYEVSEYGSSIFDSNNSFNLFLFTFHLFENPNKKVISIWDESNQI